MIYSNLGWTHRQEARTKYAKRNSNFLIHNARHVCRYAAVSVLSLEDLQRRPLYSTVYTVPSSIFFFKSLSFRAYTMWMHMHVALSHSHLNTSRLHYDWQTQKHALKQCTSSLYHLEMHIEINSIISPTLKHSPTWQKYQNNLQFASDMHL